MGKHATITICIENDSGSTFHKVMNIIYDEDATVRDIYTDLFQHTTKVYSNITFSATAENIIKILQNEYIINLLYR